MFVDMNISVMQIIRLKQEEAKIFARAERRPLRDRHRGAGLRRRRRRGHARREDRAAAVSRRAAR